MACDKIKEALKRYSECEETKNGSRINTHCLYPSFESVPVFVIGHGSGYIVHDGATAVGVAWAHGRDKDVIRKATSKAAQQYGVEVKSGQISVKIDSLEWLESAVLAVSNASAMAAHVAVEKYVRVTEKHLNDVIRDQIERFIPKKNVLAEYEVSGQSGKKYRFDFAVTLPDRSIVPVEGVVAHANSVSHKFVVFSDTLEKTGRNGFAAHEGDLSNADQALLAQVSTLVPATRLGENLKRISGGIN